MSKLQEIIDNALKNIYWVDTTGEAKIYSEYPSAFEQKYGNISTVSIVFKGYEVAKDNIEKLHNLLRNNYFEGVEQYKVNDCENAQYFSNEMIMQISVSYTRLKQNNDDSKEDDEVAYSEDSYSTIMFCPLTKNKKLIEGFLKQIVDSDLFYVPNAEKNFYMVAEGRSGLYKQKTSFKNIEIKDNRYDIYYGDKFPYEKFKRFMKDEDTESLLLLHGDPGSGKSNLLKNLIMEAEEDVIYVPPSMVSVISSPGFISFMINNKKNYLIIEDAEEILSIERNSGTNNLLGICDGFLKDALKMKVICTFNCDLKKIDPALLRKGRLYFEYRFGELTVEQGQRLADFCKLDMKVDKEMTLAEIFNYHKEVSVENSFEGRTIGFL
jgi:hypothetical protein